MNSQNQQASYGQIPLSFIANTGQTDPNVKFHVKGAGHSIFLLQTKSPSSLSGHLMNRETKPQILQLCAAA